MLLSVEQTLSYEITIAHSNTGLHINQGNLNNNIGMFGIGLEKNGYELSTSIFSNSYEQTSYSINLRKKFVVGNFYLIVGSGLVKGYTKEVYYRGRVYKNSFVFYEDYGIIYSLGVGYNYKGLDLELNTFGNYLMLTWKVRLNEFFIEN